METDEVNGRAKFGATADMTSYSLPKPSRRAELTQNTAWLVASGDLRLDSEGSKTFIATGRAPTPGGSLLPQGNE
jgi:hypothetical protein